MTIVGRESGPVSRESDRAVSIIAAISIESARVQLRGCAISQLQTEMALRKGTLRKISPRLLVQPHRPAGDGDKTRADCFDRSLTGNGHTRLGVRGDLASVEFEARAIRDRDRRQLADPVADELHILHRDAGRAHGKTFAALALDKHLSHAADDSHGLREDKAAGINPRRKLDRGAGCGAGESAREIAR